MEVVGPRCTCTSVTNASSGRPGDMDSTGLQKGIIHFIKYISIPHLKLPILISLASGCVGLDSWLDEEEYGT